MDRFIAVVFVLSLHKFFADAFSIQSQRVRRQYHHQSLRLQAHVDGESFPDRNAEIEFLGGDPFFLSDEDEEDNEQSIEDEKDDVPMSSSFLSSMASSGGGVMDTVGNVEVKSATKSATNGKTLTSKPIVEKEESFPDRNAEIEFLGGDPFFLPNEDEEDNEQSIKGQGDDVAISSSFLSEEEDKGWEWDGIVSEDAHMEDF